MYQMPRAALLFHDDFKPIVETFGRREVMMARGRGSAFPRRMNIAGHVKLQNPCPPTYSSRSALGVERPPAAEKEKAYNVFTHIAAAGAHDGWAATAIRRRRQSVVAGLKFEMALLCLLLSRLTS